MGVTVGGVRQPPPVTTFGLLDQIIAILGSTKTTFWPFLETTGDDVYSYKENVHTVTQVDGGVEGFYPRRHRGGVHSLSFNAADSQMLLGEDHADFEFGDSANDSPFSVGAWVYPTDDAGHVIMGKYREGAGNLREWQLQTLATRVYRMTLCDEDVDGFEEGDGDTALTLNEWAFLVAAYDGNEADPEMFMYLNGAVDSDGTTTETLVYTAMEPSDAKLSIGARTNVGDAAWSPFTGRIALPFVCGKQLSAVEVRNLYGIGKRLLGIDE